MSDPSQGDLPAALLRAAMRIRGEVARIRRFHAAVGDHRDLEPEVDEALRVLAAWAGRLAAGTAYTQHPDTPEVPRVEPGPLAARPRPRHPMRRTGR